VLITFHIFILNFNGDYIVYFCLVTAFSSFHNTLQFTGGLQNGYQLRLLLVHNLMPQGAAKSHDLLRESDTRDM